MYCFCAYVCADRAVVLGAQRDAWGKGYTKATVGTAVLMQLAKAVREMVDKSERFCRFWFRLSRALSLSTFLFFLYRSLQAQEESGVCKLECR